jgi:hypothetical protein
MKLGRLADVPVWGGGGAAPAAPANNTANTAATVTPAEGCPDWAPYRSANGGCSNSFVADLQALGLTDPFTGALVSTPAAAVQTVVAGGSAQWYSRADQQAIADEAERQGAARGVVTDCQVIESQSPGEAAPRFQTLCSVAGSGYEYGGDRLIAPGGWFVNQTERSAAPGAAWSSTATASRPGSPGAAPADTAPSSAGSLVAGVTEWVTGLPSWALAAAAVGAVLWFRGGGKR